MNKTSIKIIGSGPTGSLLAISLASLSIKVDIFDPLPIEKLLNNERLYAITHSSRTFFEKIGIWNDVLSLSTPFTSLLLIDNALNTSSKFDLQNLSSINQNYYAIGWTIQHNHLMKILLNRINDSELVNLYQESTTILDQYSYNFIVAADGKSSLSRKLLKLPKFSFNYNQACISSKVLLRGASDSTAYEILRDEGPLAILPLGNKAYQIIWSASIDNCYKRIRYSRSFLLDNLCSALPRGIQPDCFLGEPSIAELSFLMPFKLYKSNKIILGEASHLIHPVGGQGLNLSIRDINSLFLLFVKYKSCQSFPRSITRTFSQKRLPDIALTAIATDSIVRIFSNNNIFLLFFRRIIFYLLNRFRLPKRLLLSLMTDGAYNTFNTK